MISAETMVFPIYRNDFLRLQKSVKGLALFLLVLLLGCAPKEESADSSFTVYALSVTVNGLNGTLVLSSGTGSGKVYSAAEALAVTADGAHSFSGLANGSSYNVIVLRQPLNQTCTVSNGSGTLNKNQTSTVSSTR